MPPAPARPAAAPRPRPALPAHSLPRRPLRLRLLLLRLLLFPRLLLFLLLLLLLFLLLLLLFFLLLFPHLLPCQPPPPPPPPATLPPGTLVPAESPAGSASAASPLDPEPAEPELVGRTDGQASARLARSQRSGCCRCAPRPRVGEVGNRPGSTARWPQSTVLAARGGNRTHRTPRPPDEEWTAVPAVGMCVSPKSTLAHLACLHPGPRGRAGGWSNPLVKCFHIQKDNQEPRQKMPQGVFALEMMGQGPCP
ncbi:uncharacterized protein LOC119040090 [Artibeus jamaicensis]|uniref:uncharacterized protein LOC119040090 n=1 Tax=Artibeus jamaicensis TaxID=9417 RepID=UPI00235AC7FF|nr:uncharacterized protein LOC119040090 [Artibeus jamaicensis]